MGSRIQEATVALAADGQTDDRFLANCEQF
jgi:hypothetical protein